MTVSRSTPTRTLPTTRIGEATYASRVNEEVSKLWQFSACPLSSVGGSGNTITASVSGAAVTALSLGMSFTFVAAADNTGATTINIDSVGATSIRNADGTVLVGGEIVSGELVSIFFDGTYFRLQYGTRTSTYVYTALMDALEYNGLQVNGSCDVSQQNGLMSACIAAGLTRCNLTNNVVSYTADCWEAMYNHGAATAVFKSGQIHSSEFPSALTGFDYGHTVKATTALTSIANGDFGFHQHKVEGYRASKLLWGTSGARYLIVSFMFRAMRSGTQMLRVSNAAGNRNYHTEFAVAAGWNLVTKAIPGDTSGTWERTTSAGLVVTIFGAGKAASPATADAWTATAAVSTTGSNGVNQYSSTNDQTIVTGLYLRASSINTELPTQDVLSLLQRPFDEELQRCQRYYEKSYPYANLPGRDGQWHEGMFDRRHLLGFSGAVLVADFTLYKVTKRTAATVVLWAPDGTGVSPTYPAHQGFGYSIAGTLAWAAPSGITQGDKHFNWWISPFTQNASDTYRWHYEAFARL